MEEKKGKKKVGKVRGLYKRAESAYWQYDFYDVNGERQRGSTKTGDKAQAEAFVVNLKSKIWKTGALGELPERSWQEAVDRLLGEMEVDKMSPQTIKDYRRALNWWGVNYFGKKKLHQIDKGEVNAGVYRIAKEVSQISANRYLSAIRRMLNKAAHEWKWIAAAPDKYKQFDERPYHRVRKLSEPEIDRLLSELPDHQRMFMLFDLVTGLRQANVKGCEWSWVNWDERTLTVPGDKFKNREPLTIPLNDMALDLIRSQKGKHPKYVFTFRGQPVKSVSTKAWAKAKQRAGITDFRWHDLRHCWASLMRKLGVGTEDLQELGGWKSAEMVLRYAHADQDEMRKKVARLGEVRTLVKFSPQLVGGTDVEKVRTRFSPQSPQRGSQRLLGT